MDFIANFIGFAAVQTFWKSVKIRQSYREFNGGNFFETQCIFVLFLLFFHQQQAAEALRGVRPAV